MRIGLLGGIFLVFLALKICGVVAWSWVWVLAPLWMPIAIWFVIFLVTVGIAAIGDMAHNRAQARKKRHGLP